MSDLRILHLIPDDKFLDSAMRMFEEALPGGSTYYVWNRSSEGEIKYIKSLERIAGYAPWGSNGAEEVIARCQRGDFDAVILHSWPNWRYATTLKSFGIPIFLFTWGHEIYGYIRQKDYLAETRKAIRRTTPLRAKVRSCASWVKKLILERGRALDAFLNVDYICPVIEDDYMLLKDKYRGRLNTKMLPFSYGIGVDALIARAFARKTGSIFVGNSETWTNNHLDVFSWLKELGLTNKVIAPLSYGNNPTVQKIVIKAGYANFGERFTPWTEFMALAEYWRQVSASSYMVMGHLRQQGVGNIVAGLAVGMKVFLYEANPVYRFLVRNGFAVYSIDATRTREDFLRPIEDEEVARNRELLMRIWGHDAILRKIDGILDAVRQRRGK